MPKEVEVSQKKVAEDALILKHLITSLDDSEKKLEETYNRKDTDNFNKTKKFILNIANKISEIAE